MYKKCILWYFFIIYSSLVYGQQRMPLSYHANQTNENIEIDGILKEESWGHSNWESEFTQWEPYNGNLPSKKTEFKILYDKNNIYIGFKVFDNPDSIARLTFKRDDISGDYVGIILDTYHDYRTSFAFRISAAGTKSDHIEYNNGEGYEYSWNPVWYSNVSSDSLGWYAEIKIPFSQLRFEENSQQVWGFNIIRKIFRLSEISFWSHIPKDAPVYMQHFGELKDLQSLKPQKQLEVTPYISGQTERFESDPNNPFMTGKDNLLKMGLDGKIGISNNFITDITINPDFGQVEADPSEVNLTVFETFFEEKRQFFIEGNNITSFDLGIENNEGNNNLFYSRRIGRSPTLYPDINSSEYADIPDNTRILGAAKITGKSRNGLSVGIIESITNKEQAIIDFNGVRRKETVEPLTNYFIGRVQKDFHKGETILGAMVTSTYRDVSSDSLFNQIHKNALTAGVDFSKAFKNRTYLLETQFAFSQLSGSEESMIKLQQSPIRQFQRPEATHVSLDSSLKSLSGTGGKLIFRKIGNGHFNYKVALAWSSPGFELNDVGYLRSADNMTQLIWGGYHIWEPSGIFKDLDFNLSQWSEWDFGGTNLSTAASYSSRLLFMNNWSLITTYDYIFTNNDPYLLRGGPYLKLPQSNNFSINIVTDIKRIFSTSVYTYYNKGFNNYLSETMSGINLRYRPNSHLLFTLNLRYFTYYDKLQYVNTSDFSNQTRYVMGSIDQKTFSAPIRINIYLLPNLSVEYWGQPFVSIGKYKDFKYIKNSMANNYEDRFIAYQTNQIQKVDDVYVVDEDLNSTNDYSFHNPDFNVRNFLSNLVLKWEFIPGSTLYLIWNQSQINNAYNQSSSITKNMDMLFDNDPYNIFLLKLSYRIGR